MNPMKKICFSFIVAVLTLSCTKTEVTFADNDQGNDPSISYYDDYPVDISTYKIDSFITSGHRTFAVGYHTDTAFGTVNAASYAELVLANGNEIKDKDVSFDSLVLVLKPNGKYYGDTLLPFNLKVHRLLENIENEDEDLTTFYNLRRFSYSSIPLGQTTQAIKPVRGNEVRVRLSDVLGAELLQKLKTNATEIRTQDGFRNYFKGIQISTDSAISKSLYYFGFTTDTLVRLYYKLDGIYPEQRTYNFSLKTETQFNNITYYHSGTPLSIFTPHKKQIKNSSLTGNKAFMHNNMGSYVKINFPALQSLTETHPFVRIMRAELVIKPRPGSYAYPYRLPEKLILYSTDVNNSLSVTINYANSQTPQDGSLQIDHLYGDKTQYTFDITSFISSLINEGRFSSLALILAPYDGSLDTLTDRLIINDQLLSNSIQLKLYVLGL
jgi:hypothetical protein